MRKAVVVTRRSLNITCHQAVQGNKKQLAKQYEIHNLPYCHLKVGKLVSAIKQPTWYNMYSSIPEQNMASIHLNQMFFIVLYSIEPINKTRYYSCNIRADLFFKDMLAIN